MTAPAAVSFEAARPSVCLEETEEEEEHSEAPRAGQRGGIKQEEGEQMEKKDGNEDVRQEEFEIKCSGG